jgi:hypothetical protein
VLRFLLLILSHLIVFLFPWQRLRRAHCQPADHDPADGQEIAYAGPQYRRSIRQSVALDCVSARGLDADRHRGRCYDINRIKNLDSRTLRSRGQSFIHMPEFWLDPGQVGDFIIFLKSLER